MPTWYEVFDNSEVQYVTRRQVAMVTGLLASMLVLALCAAIYTRAHDVPLAVVGGALLGLWAMLIFGCLVRLRRLRRVMWCVKLSDREVVGYDYARRKVRVDWIDAVRVELNAHGLAVVGTAGCRLEVPHLFPDFATLSHRIVQYAEFYDVPVYVGGQPWQQVDVFELFPFLEEGMAPGPPPAQGAG